MGIFGLVLSLFGAGAAIAKSEHDARQKMNSQYVKEIDEERRWLEQKPSGMYRQCKNRVLEFDVAHAETRKIYSEIDPERLRKWEVLGVAIQRYSLNGFLRKCCERPNYSGYQYRWELDLAEQNGIFEELDRLGFDVDNPQITEKLHKWGLRQGRMKAMDEWFKNNHPEYKDVTYPQMYSVYDYIYEIARKTAYDNGYYPSSYKPGRIHSGYPTVYDGRYLAGLRSGIDFMYGIPNQEERARLAQLDKEFPK